jgi:hypothetical protein
VVIVPIVRKDTDRAAVNEAVDKLAAALKQAGVRVKVRGAIEMAVYRIHTSSRVVCCMQHCGLLHSCSSTEAVAPAAKVAAVLWYGKPLVAVLHVRVTATCLF